MASYRGKLKVSQQRPGLRPNSGIGSTSPGRFYSPLQTSSGKRVKGKSKASFVARLIPDQFKERPGRLYETPEFAIRKSNITPVVVSRHQRTSSDYSIPETKRKPKRSGMPLTQLPSLAGLDRSINVSPDPALKLKVPVSWRTAKNSRSSSRQRSL